MNDSDTPTMPAGPIGGSFAWTVPQVLARDDWNCRLEAGDLEEIDAAVQFTRERGLTILEIGRDEFPLDRLTTRLGALRAQIRSGLGFGYIKGLPVERYDRETLMRIYWGLCRHIGDPVTQNRNGHLVGHVIDVGDAVGDANKRITQTNAELCFHADSCDVVALLCVNRARTGGESMIVSGIAVHDELMRRRPDLLPELYRPVYMDRRGEVPAGKLPWFGVPLFNWHRGQFTGYSPVRQYIESLARFPEAPRMSNAQREALDLYYAICEEDAFCLRLQFERGDIQFLQNHVIFHSRTAYEDWPEPERRRHLMRLWLSLPDGRTLAPALAEKWINIEVGTRRGGVPATAEPVIPDDPFTRAYA
ncbi:MAG: TauD/TfdA family dioxygenase [Thalassobaculum sp.]|uniref:TauD/TfdA family dioxygenase n=1 Tax=Thalassobaculum sp. TaxID=2022740 RepID=UPI0032EC491D